MVQPESHDPLDSIHPAEILIPDPSSEIEILRVAVPPEDISEFVPSTEDPAVVVPHFKLLSRLRVTKVGEVGTAVRPSGFASPSLIITLAPQRASSGLILLLRRGDSKVALGYGDFL